MKIFKPDSLGVIYRSFRWAGQDRLAVGLMACFEFGKSNRLNLLPEPELWKKAATALGSNAILDEAWPKPAGEFLVFGSAYAPAGMQVAELVASARLGSLEKSLFVRGDRHFNALGMVSEPRPFSRMPIVPATAFGGQGFLSNPHGKGLQEIRVDGDFNARPLPNVESAAQPVLSAGDRPLPAGFWAYAPDAPERSKHLDAFDQRWLGDTWPHLPKTSHADYFLTAPPDQRLAGFFRGDEAIGLRNMNSSEPAIASSLPGLRARCFVNRQVSGGQEFLEIEARAETVWLFPGLSCGIVLYRAVMDVEKEDAEDVLHVMAEWESLDDAPLSRQHYHEEFLKQLHGTVQVAGVASQETVPVQPAVAPANSLAASAPLAGAIAAPGTSALAGGDVLAQSPELQELHRLAAGLNKNTQEVMQQHGITQADLAPFMKEEPELPPRSLEEIYKLAADLEANSREVMAQHKLTDKDLEPFIPKPEIESADPVGDLAKAMTELNADTRATMTRLGITPADIEAQMAKNPDLSGIAVNPSPDVTGIMTALAAVMPAVTLPKPEVPNLALPVPDALPLVAMLPKLTRDGVVARHADGQSFVSHDLSGVDLSELDLAGADFSGALLEKTSFKNSSLAGAVLKDALLSGGDFSGADLSGAMLAGVSAGSTVFARTRMSGANVSKGDFTGADFSQALLENSNISLAIFDGSKMAGLKAGNCNAQQASFADCDLGAADFTDARLTAAVFTSAKLGKANFTNTACDNAEFYGVNATQANFTSANLKASRADATSQFAEAQLGLSHLGRAAWEGVQLAKANLEGAVLDDADFSRAQAADARFSRASAKGAKFDKADISRADFTGVNLFKGSMRHTKTEATLLRKANLYGVDFYGASPTLASLEGSNIDQTLLVIRKPVV